MHDRHFDALTRRLEGVGGRRSLLGAVAITLLARSVLPESALACKKVGRKCDKTKDCCDGAKCKNDKCKCKNRFTKCDKRCYDLDKDEKHCGTCNASCGCDEACCSGQCIDLQRDNLHCGACGAACPDPIDYACLDGECVPR
jgi:hypothetical protein